jgi:hypothetical protein
MIPLRKEKGIAAAAIGILSSAILAPTAWGRDRLPPAPRSSAHEQQGGACTNIFNHPANCFVYGFVWQLSADGAAARFDVRSYTAPDAGDLGHTNQALWLGVQNSQPWTEDGYWGEFCEVGWTKAFHGDGNYRQYMAFYVNGVYDDSLVYYPITPGQSYHYQVLREYNGKYNVYIDFVDVHDCFANPASTWVRTGLEHSSTQATAAVNDPRELQWRDLNLNWHAWGDQGIPVYEQQIGPYPRWAWEQFPTHGEDWIQH